MFNRRGRQALREYIELSHRKSQREEKKFSVQFVLGLFYQHLTSAYPPNRCLVLERVPIWASITSSPGAR